MKSLIVFGIALLVSHPAHAHNKPTNVKVIRVGEALPSGHCFKRAPGMASDDKTMSYANLYKGNDMLGPVYVKKTVIEGMLCPDQVGTSTTPLPQEVVPEEPATAT